MGSSGSTVAPRGWERPCVAGRHLRPVNGGDGGNAALRDQAWLTASDSSGRPSLPFYAAAQQEPESIVVEVAIAVTDAADLLDEQVDRLGRPVRQLRGVVGEDLVLPGADGGGQ